MQEFERATANALELYIQQPTASHAMDVMAAASAWPVNYSGRNAGFFLAFYEVFGAREHIRAGGGYRVRFGAWLMLKTTAPFRPTWNDYWVTRWKLYERREPELATRALEELHRRAYHAYDSPEWGMCRETASWAIASLYERSPAFKRDYDRVFIRCAMCKLTGQKVNAPGVQLPGARAC